MQVCVVRLITCAGVVVDFVSVRSSALSLDNAEFLLRGARVTHAPCARLHLELTNQKHRILTEGVGL